MGHGIKIPQWAKYPWGGMNIHLTRGEGTAMQPCSVRPTECRCYIKEETSFMAQRVRKPYRGRNRPSSATQLPILAALHAGLPTLFAINIHDSVTNVKTQNGNFFIPNACPPLWGSCRRLRGCHDSEAVSWLHPSNATPPYPPQRGGQALVKAIQTALSSVPAPGQ